MDPVLSLFKKVTFKGTCGRKYLLGSCCSIHLLCSSTNRSYIFSVSLQPLLQLTYVLWSGWKVYDVIMKKSVWKGKDLHFKWLITSCVKYFYFILSKTSNAGSLTSRTAAVSPWS